ncbi:hypothetical protein N7532_009226 [Penicillium argentinense]|uniref:Uncharacterized protein n=1 Tax=Penicillium argentinense TaxID=1131581 RepID=A0A9W9K397_9EURO|nr:uncharacterized protein N7532_009226 [Penicillium argentinense]KAJ5090542.1 hypothetical protein N7532_009226 [Penicillium argentinense]
MACITTVGGFKVVYYLNQLPGELIPESFRQKADDNKIISGKHWPSTTTDDIRNVEVDPSSIPTGPFHKAFVALPHLPPFEKGIWEAGMEQSSTPLSVGAINAQDTVMFEILEQISDSVSLKKAVGAHSEVALRPERRRFIPWYEGNNGRQETDARSTNGSMAMKFDHDERTYRPAFTWSSTERQEPFETVLWSKAKLLLGQLFSNQHFLYTRKAFLRDQEGFHVVMHGTKASLAKAWFPGKMIKRTWLNSLTHRQRYFGTAEERMFEVKVSREYDLRVKSDFSEFASLLLALLEYLISGDSYCGILRDEYQKKEEDADPATPADKGGDAQETSPPQAHQMEPLQPGEVGHEPADPQPYGHPGLAPLAQPRSCGRNISVRRRRLSGQQRPLTMSPSHSRMSSYSMAPTGQQGYQPYVGHPVGVQPHSSQQTAVAMSPSHSRVSSYSHPPLPPHGYNLPFDARLFRPASAQRNYNRPNVWAQPRSGRQRVLLSPFHSRQNSAANPPATQPVYNQPYGGPRGNFAAAQPIHPWDRWGQPGYLPQPGALPLDPLQFGGNVYAVPVVFQSTWYNNWADCLSERFVDPGHRWGTSAYTHFQPQPFDYHQGLPANASLGRFPSAMPGPQYVAQYPNRQSVPTRGPSSRFYSSLPFRDHLNRQIQPTGPAISQSPSNMPSPQYANSEPSSVGQLEVSPGHIQPETPILYESQSQCEGSLAASSTTEIVYGTPQQLKVTRINPPRSTTQSASSKQSVVSAYRTQSEKIALSSPPQYV